MWHIPACRWDRAGGSRATSVGSCVPQIPSQGRSQRFTPSAGRAPRIWVSVPFILGAGIWWDLVGFGGIWALGLQPGRRGGSGQVPMGGFEQGVSQKERDQGQRRVPRGWKEWNWETESRQRADPAQLCPILQQRSRAREAREQEEQCGGPCKVEGGQQAEGSWHRALQPGCLGSGSWPWMQHPGRDESEEDPQQGPDAPGPTIPRRRGWAEGSPSGT